MENYHVRSSPDDDDDIDKLRKAMEGYSFSADVSESESCSGASTLSYDLTSQVASASLSSSHQFDYSTDSDFPARLTVMLPVVGGRHVIIPAEKKPEKTEITELSVVDLMRERFAKLLLGEDMSGGGTGVCTALAISNAITNLAASVFGELWKLEPLGQRKKSMWLQEMDWLLCVSDYIVELIPSVKEFPGGKTFEAMITQSRSDLSVNLPALKELDKMLLSILDGFRDCEFYYVDRGIIFADGEYKEAKSFPPSSGRPSISFEEKLWLPFPKVPPNCLSEETREGLQQCRECTNQIYKAAVAINSNVLAEMEIPKDYLDKLPKSGKARLGEMLFSYITGDQFSPECLLDYLDFSSKYTALEIANRVEDALHFWRQKYVKKKVNQRRTGRSPWSASVKGLLPIEKTKTFTHRAETVLRKLKLQFPTLPQTVLDTMKIQNNKDVGLSILESYSRVMESLAFNVMARIDDLLYVDDVSRLRAAEESAFMFSSRGSNGVFPLHKQATAGPISLELDSCASLLRKPAFGSAAPNFRKAKKTNVSLGDPMHKKLPSNQLN